MKKRKLIIILLLFVAFVAWMVWGNITVGVTHYTINSDKIPLVFDGYKIVSISDFHNANYGNDNDKLIEKIKNEKPDIIVITGDFIDCQKTNIDIAESFIKRLMEIAPCYYVTGNHEANALESYAKLKTIMNDAGVRVLCDEVIQIRRGNEIIQLAGLDDPFFTSWDSYEHESMLETKIEWMNLTDDYSILLCHRPELFDAYVSGKLDLVFSGHAHGGQFRIPFIGGVAAPNQGFFPKYDAGLFTEGKTNMIVSRGIGNSIIPVRFNNRPEIVSVELICKR